MAGVGEGVLISVILSCFVLYKLLAIDKFYLQGPIWDTQKSEFHVRRFPVVLQNESLYQLKTTHKNTAWQLSLARE